MQASSEFLKKNNIVPFISFKGNPIHTVTLKEDKQDKLLNDKNEEVFGVTYVVEEEGQMRKFFTSSIGLITKLSQYNINDEVTIEMKSKKAIDGKWKSYFIVTSGDEKQSSVKEIDDNEIPVIQEEDSEINVDDIPL